MDNYIAPLDDIAACFDAVGLDDLLDNEAFSHVDRSTVDDLLAEFGRLAADVVTPTDSVGDRVGSVLDAATGTVAVPPGLRDAYRAWVEGGWGAISVEIEHGGGGLPSVVALAVQEMLTAANMALSLCPMLTRTAVELLSTFGSERQRTLYLPHLVTGEWTGTMVLTEPDAGSDVGAVRTRAHRGDDGRWRISGTKIFITWGDHDMADNVVHLVLARTPGAPPGTKGLSLFVVPKRLVGDDGTLGEANAVRCVKLEEKVGIHASPTCVMEFDGAVGELVGEEREGMRLMFTMMNAARLAIGVQGLSVAERAMQQAERYAAARVQGRAPGRPSTPLSPIADHPDVRRMLLTTRSSVAAMRRLLYTTAQQADVARNASDPDSRARAAARLALLTPVAKAWCTDTGVAVASLVVQVHGGMGYIEESGVPQRWRDSRIAPIYEGTNGIQAIDLVTRKLRGDNGEAMRLLLAEMRADVAGFDNLMSRAVLADALATLEQATSWMLARDAEELTDVLAGATSYLELCGIVIGGWLLTRTRHPLAAFYATEVVARAAGLLVPVTAGATRLALDDSRDNWANGPARITTRRRLA